MVVSCNLASHCISKTRENNIWKFIVYSQNSEGSAANIHTFPQIILEHYLLAVWDGISKCTEKLIISYFKEETNWQSRKISAEILW